MRKLIARKKWFVLEYVILVGLILLAAGLGVAIYKKASGNAQAALPILPSETLAIIPSISQSPSAQDVLHPPSSNATPKEQQAFFQLVSTYAKTADALTISQCKATPVAFKTPLEKQISFKNTDNRTHTIVFDPQNQFTLPANSTQSVTVVYHKGPGIYGFGCDGSSQAVGMVLVTAQ